MASTTLMSGLMSGSPDLLPGIRNPGARWGAQAYLLPGTLPFSGRTGATACRSRVDRMATVVNPRTAEPGPGGPGPGLPRLRRGQARPSATPPA
jgi:hypothetical protein